MNPFSSALHAYHSGDLSAAFVIRRDDGFEQRVPASVFFADHKFSPLEASALDLCNGQVLDIGAAAGRHSLELIRRGLSVTSLDVLPDAGAILRDRGMTRIVISDIRLFREERFNTLLMLMNGIGMVGTLEGLDEFLEHAHQIIQAEGQIICDSMDVSVTDNPVHSAYRERNIQSGLPPGQQTFTIAHNEIAGAPFNWLHIDFLLLADQCKRAGWNAELITQEPSGHYLCRLTEIGR